MTLDQLRYLVAVNKTRHVGKASRLLSISPSAISHALNALATEFGVPILVKIGRNIVLSPEAEFLVEKARSILGQVDSLTSQIQGREQFISGSISISATHGVPVSFTAKAVSKLQEKYPQVRTDISSKPSIEVLKDIQNSTAELGVCFNPQKHSELGAELLFRERLIIAVRSGHPNLKSAKSNRIKMMSDLPCAMPMSKFGIENCQQHPVLISAGIKLSVAVQYDDYGAGIAYLRTSNAWSLIPESYVTSSNMDGEQELREFVRLEKDAFAEVTAVWNKKKGLNAVGNLMMECLKENASRR